MKRMIFPLLGTVLLSWSALASEESCISVQTDIVEKVKCLENVTVTTTREASGIRVIDMLYKQPMSHTDATGESFEQRIVLLHRSVNEPMLLQTSGYSIFGIRLAHIARVFETNQIQIEHRYFEKSIPNNPDYKYLNIKESADDFHAITESFKKIYNKPWVNTGASKGGMTSMYHKYFYPNDLVGTVADVAPLSFSRADQRYNTFLENVGGDKYKACREAFKNLQVRLLKSRELFVPFITEDYDILGGADVAYEHSVIESSFSFWQYSSPSKCTKIESLTDIEDIYDFLQEVNSRTSYSDARVTQFMPYYFQAATQLGGPASLTSHLEEDRLYELDLAPYAPMAHAIPYSNQTMREVREWAKTDADQIMYVYGEFDPWTAAEFPVSVNGKATHKFYVPAGNHSANFTQLVGPNKDAALDILSNWLGKGPATEKSVNANTKSLDQIEFEIRKKMRL